MWVCHTRWGGAIRGQLVCRPCRAEWTFGAVCGAQPASVRRSPRNPGRGTRRPVNDASSAACAAAATATDRVATSGVSVDATVAAAVACDGVGGTAGGVIVGGSTRLACLLLAASSKSGRQEDL